MRFYETVFIVRPDVTAAQVEALTQNYIALVQQDGGEVSKTEFCGLRTLAYRIKKHRKAHYVLMNLKTRPEVIKEIERQMKMNDDVLRVLTLQVEELDNNPSPLMQQKSYRSDRSRGYEGLDDISDDLESREFTHSRSDSTNADEAQGDVA